MAADTLFHLELMDDSLVRRLLHAMMTNGDFVVVVAGHSSAAGHGNHFRQSYIMQMHKVMAPIFARLGVKLITRNISLGGLGTVQGTMGAADIYGRDIDILIWDSGQFTCQYFSSLCACAFAPRFTNATTYSPDYQNRHDRTSQSRPYRSLFSTGPHWR